MELLRFRKNATEEMGRLMQAFTPAAIEDGMTASLARDAERLANVIDNSSACITNNELRSCFAKAAIALRSPDAPEEQKILAENVMRAGLTYKAGLSSTNVLSAMVRSIEIEQELEHWAGYPTSLDIPPPLTENQGGQDEAEIILGTEKDSRKACIFALLDIGAIVHNEEHHAFHLTPIGHALRETLASQPQTPPATQSANIFHIPV